MAFTGCAAINVQEALQSTVRAELPVAYSALFLFAPSGVHSFNLRVDDEKAQGLIALPQTSKPHSLVVLCHALGYSPDHFRPFMEELARNGSVVIAMSYRGELGTYNVANGVADTVAGTSAVLRQFPSIDNVLIYGWSMGGEVSGLTIDAMPAGTFDTWIVGSGVMDLGLLWQEQPVLRPLVEIETGGTPLTVPDQYASRSPYAHARSIADKDVAEIVFLHGELDAVVSYAQSTRMRAVLAEYHTDSTLVSVSDSLPRWDCAAARLPCNEFWTKAMFNHEAGDLRLAARLIRAVLHHDDLRQVWGPEEHVHVSDAF